MTARRKTKNETRSSATIGILVALASLLGAMNVGFVSLYAAKLACGPPAMESSEAQQQVKRKLFWKKTPPPPQPKASSFCRNVWTVIQHVPLLAPPPSQAQPEPETCSKEEKKNPIQKLVSIFKRKKERSTTSTLSSTADFPTAFASYTHPTKLQEKLIHKLALQFREYVNDPHHLDARLKNVSWAGNSDSEWWHGHDGGFTLPASYLKVMDWPSDLQSSFPFGICAKEKCPSAFALSHTFSWRESYKPWMMSPSAIHENRQGFVYARGHGKSLSREKQDGHGMVWIRSGVHTSPPDPISYFRALLNSLDRAISETLQRSHQKVGKFNVVIDAHGASFQYLPKLGDAKKGIVMLQDHYPNRLGMIILCNFSRVAEFLLTMIKPLITKEVRDKILILPKDISKRKEILEAIVENEYIPDYLGGTDTFRFNAKEYYSDASLQFSDEEARRYQTEMPYHA